MARRGVLGAHDRFISRRIGFRQSVAELVGPAIVMRDDLIGDIGHFGSPLLRTPFAQLGPQDRCATWLECS
ncbi:hypothetical protein RHECNPAF_2940022 [Rhizobium etli CNPAF512]|nr:hypothetical protein RHECNPAF_2940022 [Rhizobium etli CNPAF512]